MTTAEVRAAYTVPEATATDDCARRIEPVAVQCPLAPDRLRQAHFCDVPRFRIRVVGYYAWAISWAIGR